MTMPITGIYLSKSRTIIYRSNGHRKFERFLGLMELPFHIEKKDLNPGSSNSQYPHCMASTYFHGQQVIAYGSSHYVVIASSSLTVLNTLEGHPKGSNVTAVAFAPYSGRLSTCSEAGDLIIWEPVDGNWINTCVIMINDHVNCISWSICDHQFCLSSEKFMIFRYIQESRNKFSYKPKYMSDIKTKFCSFSRDSRFILTLQDTDQEVIIWYKRPEQENDYRKIPLFHPSPVKMMRWRTSDNIHERCSFMTLAEDKVVRIWTETSVNETLAFNVVASIPGSYGSLSAAFLTTSSRMIKNNANHYNVKTVDTYAYGHGHLPVCDLDYREANIAGERELRRNRSWIITSDDSHHILVWELSGISVSVRRTPQLTLLSKVDVKYKAAPENCNQMFAVCRLQSEFGHFKERDFIGRPASISILLQNQMTGMIESFDITLGATQKPIQIAGRTQGHNAQIKMIRINSELPLMVTVDDAHQALVWKYDDTDVYDPNVLTKFGCMLKHDVIAADWVGPTRQLFAFSGREFLVFDIPIAPSPAIPVGFRELAAPFEASVMIDFRFCGALMDGSLFVALTRHCLYVLFVRNDTVEIVLEKSGNYVFGASAYIASVFPMAGATIYFFATASNEVHSIVLRDTTTPRVSVELAYQTSERIVTLDYSHPGYLFVVTNKSLRVTWRVCSDTFRFEEINTVSIPDGPVIAASIPSGMLAVVGKRDIHLYHAVREGRQFPRTQAEWVHAATTQISNVSAMEWSLDGILIVASHTKLHAFTKFMDTFFLKADHLRFPSIHSELAKYARGPSDYHADTIIPLAVAGRFKLLASMIEALNATYDNPINRGRFLSMLLDFPVEDPEATVTSPELDKNIEELIEKLQRDPPPEFNRHETDHLIIVLKNFNSLQSERIKAIEPKGQPVARAMLINRGNRLPFDLFIPVLRLQYQQQLVNSLNMKSWEDIEASGSVFWLRDITDLYPIIVPIAAEAFQESRYIAILLLTLVGRFKVLQKLFTKIGDDTRAAFFIRDFSTPKNKKFAEKNAYSALSKHDFHIAASMFFLAGEMDSVVNVLGSRLGNKTLAMLACRCLDARQKSNISFTEKYITAELLPSAREKGDLAAICVLEYYLKKEDEKPFDIRPRLNQSVPGYVDEAMAHLGDLRYNLVDTMKPPTSVVADYMRTLMNEGFPFLAVTLIRMVTGITIPEFRQLRESPDIFSVKKSHSCDHIGGITPHVSFVADESSSDTEDYSSQQERPRHNPRNMFPLSKSLAAFNKVAAQNFNPDFLAGEASAVKENAKEEEEEEDKSESSNYDDPFGYTGGGFDFDDYSNSSSSSENSSSSSSSSENEDDENSEKEEEKNTEIVPKEEENTLESQWFSVVIVYNACRYRLEYFLETQYFTPSQSDGTFFQKLVMIHPEVIAASPLTAAISHQIHEYLMRTAKRRCFVFRRLLLMPTEADKFSYILEVCKNLSMIPDQIISMRTSSQQVTQIAMTAQILMVCINNMLIHFEDFPGFNFIIASIVTALFMYAFFYQDTILMHRVLALDLKTLKRFPYEIIESLEIKNPEPGEFRHDEIASKKEGGSFFSFLLPETVRQFTVTGADVDDHSLHLFATALIDFLLVDTFVRNIYDLFSPCSEFDRLYQFLRKMHDLYLQLFQYATLNFTVFLEIQSLASIRLKGNQELNSLLDFLLSQNQREQMIQSFCLNLLNKFSDTNLVRYTTLPPKSRLKGCKKIARYKVPLRGIAINCTGDTIMAATDDGLQLLHPSLDVDVPEPRDEEEPGEFSMIPDVSAESIDVVAEPDDLVIEEDRPEYDHELLLASSPPGSPNNNSQELLKIGAVKPGAKGKHYMALIAHPTKNFAFVGESDGGLWMASFENAQPIARFEVPRRPCRAIAVSPDGAIMAAAHGPVVSLYSFCTNDLPTEPFGRYDTWGARVSCLEFVKGTGLFACGQTPSERCKATVTFWDTLLPNSSAMIASVKLPKGVLPTTMVYSPRFNQLVTGASDGYIYVIDSRTFAISSTYHAHDKAVRKICVDKNEAYVVSAGNERPLKAWDMRMGRFISSFDLSSKTSMRSYQNVGIQIFDDNIYAAYPNGSIFGLRLSQ